MLQENKKEIKIFVVMGVIILSGIIFLVQAKLSKIEKKYTQLNSKVQKSNMNVKSDWQEFSHFFREDFEQDKIIEEASNMEESEDTNWWLNSGAQFFVNNGEGRTIFNRLEIEDEWRVQYEDYNSRETSGGFRPQNIFRLITRARWQNLEQECYFKIKFYELSADKHRAASNGILLLNRYKDEDNLYYTGLRVDGTVVVKKKYKKEYYTMGQEKVLKGKYNRDNKPNLISENEWVGVRSRVETLDDDKVQIKVFVNFERGSDDWREVLSVVDDGVTYGGPAILGDGYAGIRTDFMDVEFDDYKIGEVN
jgi:hypothetical protein